MNFFFFLAQGKELKVVIYKCCEQGSVINSKNMILFLSERLKNHVFSESLYYCYKVNGLFSAWLHAAWGYPQMPWLTMTFKVNIFGCCVLWHRFFFFFHLVFFSVSCLHVGASVYTCLSSVLGLNFLFSFSFYHCMCLL